MDIRYTADPVRFERLTTAELRESFLIEGLFAADRICMNYCDVDRAIVGSAVPASTVLTLEAAPELRAEFFCERRELGILNIGDAGTVTVDGASYPMSNRDGLYVGRGSQSLTFASEEAARPARYYLVSFPAHVAHPTTHIQQSQAAPVRLGGRETSNERTLYKLIHPGGAKSCQLVMGFTVLEPGCVWNTMPPHTHERRMEVYLYFDMPETARVFHFMGTPESTRHLVVANDQAVISPSWSIHCGAGTSAYTFCWAMGGENQDFDDMDHLALSQLK